MTCPGVRGHKEGCSREGWGQGRHQVCGLWPHIPRHSPSVPHDDLFPGHGWIEWDFANGAQMGVLGDGQFFPGCTTWHFPFALVFLSLASSQSPTLLPAFLPREISFWLVKSFPPVSGQDSLVIYNQEFCHFISLWSPQVFRLLKDRR